MLYRWMAVCVLLITCLSLQPAAEAADWEDGALRTTDDLEKSWTVTFSKDVDSKSLTRDNLFIEDLAGKKLPVTWKAEGKKVLVTPDTPYTNHTEYRLHILSSVKSTDGKTLKEDIRFTFKTMADKVSELPYAKSFELKNTTNEYRSVDIGTIADYVIYNKEGKVENTKKDVKGKVLVYPQGTAILSYDVSPALAPASSAGLTVTQTAEPAFKRVKVQKGATAVFHSVNQESFSIPYIEGGTFDYASYNGQSIDEYNTAVESGSYLNNSSSGKLVVTATGDEDTVFYGAGRQVKFAAQSEPALVSATVKPGESFVLKNRKDRLNFAKLASRSVYDYTQYPYPSANEHAYHVASFYDQDSLVIKGNGETVFTNQDVKEVALFAPYENVEMKLSDEPAARVMTLHAGESVHATYGVSEVNKDGVLLEVRGNGTIDYSLNRGERNLETVSAYEVKDNEVISVIYGEESEGTFITNTGTTDMAMQLPYRFTKLDKNAEPALTYHDIKPGESIHVKTTRIDGIVRVKGNNADYIFYKITDYNPEWIAESGTVAAGQTASKGIPRGGRIIIKNTSKNGAVLTAYVDTLHNKFYVGTGE